jgi:hypothetical protein
MDYIDFLFIFVLIFFDMLNRTAVRTKFIFKVIWRHIIIYIYNSNSMQFTYLHLEISIIMISNGAIINILKNRNNGINQ